jgi:hypothetical protein
VLGFDGEDSGVLEVGHDFSLLKLCCAVPDMFGGIEGDVPVVLFHANLYRLSFCPH